MLSALLAGFLLRLPATVQAVVLGLCTGCFVSTAAEAHDRTPLFHVVVVQVLVTTVLAGGLFLAGLRTQSRIRQPGEDGVLWLYLLYSAVWLGGIAAALTALFGAGGFRVAALAIVPLVLLAPAALLGLRLAVRRTPA